MYYSYLLAFLVSYIGPVYTLDPTIWALHVNRVITPEELIARGLELMTKMDDNVYIVREKNEDGVHKRRVVEGKLDEWKAIDNWTHQKPLQRSKREYKNQLSPSVDLESSHQAMYLQSDSEVLLGSNNKSNALEKVALYAKKTSYHGLADSIAPIMSKETVMSSSDNFTDPLFPKQWYTHNTSLSTRFFDLHSIWDAGFNGSSIKVTIIDDGIQTDHPDWFSYDQERSWNVATQTNDPNPDDLSDTHGTNCAGVLAALPNGICGVGISWGVSLAAIKMDFKKSYDFAEAQAFAFRKDLTDIYVSSWGPIDEPYVLEAPGELATKAIRDVSQTGRGGRGGITIFASGNGGYMDGCNYDGYANSEYIITVGAADYLGRKPAYAEFCAATAVVAWSNTNTVWETQYDIATSAIKSSCASEACCSTSFGGTSAAAPMVGGIVALILQIRPELTWRDVRALLINTADVNSLSSDEWTTNGAGKMVSYYFGFGVVNVTSATNMASQVALLPHPAIVMESNTTLVDVPIVSNDVPITEVFEVQPNDPASSITQLESVQVTIWLEHSYRGNVRISLQAPSGTVSVLANPRSGDNGTTYDGWVFSSLRHWGESPIGRWELKIEDIGTSGQGTFHSWKLRFTGICDQPYWIPRDSTDFVKNPYCSGNSVIALEDGQLNSTLRIIVVGIIVMLIVIIMLICFRKPHQVEYAQLNNSIDNMSPTLGLFPSTFISSEKSRMVQLFRSAAQKLRLLPADEVGMLPLPVTAGIKDYPRSPTRSQRGEDIALATVTVVGDNRSSSIGTRTPTTPVHSSIIDKNIRLPSISPSSESTSESQSNVIPQSRSRSQSPSRIMYSPAAHARTQPPPLSLKNMLMKQETKAIYSPTTPGFSIEGSESPTGLQRSQSRETLKSRGGDTLDM